MNSLWPNQFNEIEIKYGKEILEEQSSILPNLTNNMVVSDITKMTKMDVLLSGIKEADFQYSFYLRANLIDNYTFKLFSISYNIMGYPLDVIIDEETQSELELPSRVIELPSQHEFEVLLSKILQSQYVGDIIGAVMKFTSVSLKTTSSLPRS